MPAGEQEYKCFIVDDKQLDRLATAAQVKKYPFFKMAGMFASAREAIDAAPAKNPDVLFLDIDMPDIDGLELRRELQKIPACVFISSYPEYALKTFSVNTLDFLVKPIRPERFEITARRVQQFMDNARKAETLDHTLNNESIFIKDGYEHIRVQFYDILYLEALDDYTGIVTKEKKYRVLTSLRDLLLEKPFHSFVRIHRSYAVQKRFVRHATGKSLTINDTLLPIGKSYLQSVEKWLNL